MTLDQVDVTPPPPTAATPSPSWRRPPASPDRRFWTGVALLALLWSAGRAGISPSGLVNVDGWPQVTRFFGAMLAPRLDAEFVGLAAREAVVTVGYAVLGTALGLVIGAVGGLLVSERMWAPLAGELGVRRLAWTGTRFTLAIPRSVHEVVFGLLLVSVLGLDPLVAILAIGLPFGAVIAKVFSELIDEAPRDAELALRAAGASGLVALVYGTLPSAFGDLLSYGFYRFECALRSAAVLGIVGAGGLGFQLAQSFISLRYDEMWTFLWALIILSGLADLWSSMVRRRRNSAAVEMHLDRDRPRAAPRRDRFLTASVAAFVVAVPVAAWWLSVDPTTLWSDRARRLATELVVDSWPPQIGRGGFGELMADSLDTVALALLSIAIAVVLAVPLALLAARPEAGRPGVDLVGRTVGWLARFVLLVARAVPPPVGAFIVVFVLFPGLWPGAVALGIYNAGVLGRLAAEVVENVDEAPAAALRASGASGFGALLFATIPAVAAKFTALSLYRWEVAIRETVVVGVVGAAGLGRRLDEQSSAFDYDGILATLIALVVVTLVVDLVSAAVRRSLR